MFYLSSRLSGLLGAPMDAVLLIAGATTIYSTLRVSRSANRFAAAAILVFLLASLTPVGYWLLFPLENRFPRWQTSPEAVDGIIALGGEERTRVDALVQLGRRFPKARLYLVGIAKEETSEVQARVADLGGDPGRLLIENESRNTSENAINAAAMIHPNPDQSWILITSARHMPRAVGCFRASGFKVIPYSVDFVSKNGAPATYMNLAIKEWLGLIAYRLAGKTDEFWPAP